MKRGAQENPKLLVFRGAVFFLKVDAGQTLCPALRKPDALSKPGRGWGAATGSGSSYTGEVQNLPLPVTQRLRRGAGRLRQARPEGKKATHSLEDPDRRWKGGGGYYLQHPDCPS